MMQVTIRHEVRLTSPAFSRPFSGGRYTDQKSDRTSELRKKGYIGRRLGPKQMTTDTAVRVTRMVAQERSEQRTSVIRSSQSAAIC